MFSNRLDNKTTLKRCYIYVLAALRCNTILFCVNIQSLVISHTVSTDLQQQIKEQQNKTDMEMARLENTLTECKNATAQNYCFVQTV